MNFLSSNRKDVDFNAFQKLTSGKVIIDMNPNAALTFLYLEGSYKVNNNGDGDGDGVGDGDKTKDQPLALTDLQKRCVDSFINSNLERPESNEFRKFVIKKIMMKYPLVLESYLDKTFDSFRKTKNENCKLSSRVEELEGKSRVMKKRKREEEHSNRTRVLAVLREYDNGGDQGVSVDTCVQRLRDMSISKIRQVLELLSDDGDIFSTVNENYFKVVS